MASMSYKEQLLHPNWQKKRLEILSRDKFKCTVCEDDDSTLHVHHKRYIKGRLAWDYENSNFCTLCHACHSAAHDDDDALKAILAALPATGPRSSSDVGAIIAGWAHGVNELNFSEVFNQDPIAFAIGELAGQFDRFDINRLMGVVAALRAAPDWVVDVQLDKFIEGLRGNAGVPMPPGYKEDLL